MSKRNARVRRVADLGPIVQFIDYTVASWCPDDHAMAPPEQVHFILRMKDFPLFALRLKSARACDELIAALQKHRADVWPDQG